MKLYFYLEKFLWYFIWKNYFKNFFLIYPTYFVRRWRKRIFQVFDIFRSSMREFVSAGVAIVESLSDHRREFFIKKRSQNKDACAFWSTRGPIRHLENVGLPIAERETEWEKEREEERVLAAAVEPAATTTT